MDGCLEGGVISKQDNMLFKGGEKHVPADLPLKNIENGLLEVRAAGNNSNNRSVAAAELMVHMLDNEAAHGTPFLSQAEKAWTCIFLAKGLVYRDTELNIPFVSLARAACYWTTQSGQT